MRSVSLAAAADQDELLQPELLGDVTLGVLCFAHASCRDSPDPKRKHVAIFYDEEGRCKSLAPNQVLNDMLAHIAPPGAEPLTLCGDGILCFMDMERGGAWSADMHCGPNAIRELVRGILEAQAHECCASKVPYIIGRVTADMRAVDSGAQLALKRCLLFGLKEQGLTPGAWMLQRAPSAKGATLRAVASKKARLFLESYIAGDDGCFVGESGEGRPSEQEWSDLLDAATDLIEDAVLEAQWP